MIVGRVMMKPQDILVLLKLAAHPGAPWTYNRLAESVGLSASETHASAQRLVLSGLARGAPMPVPVRAAVHEFLAHGLRYVFPAEYTRVTRGVPTAASAPSIAGALELVTPELPVVWPLSTGAVRGQGLVPVHPSMPTAALRDPELHELLALADLLRIGSARERSLAIKALQRETCA